MSMTDDFRTFLSNLSISAEMRSSISNRYERITQQLNTDYRNNNSKTANSRYVGSYGRGTAISGFSDMDMLFELPYSVYSRFNGYAGNGQSALLAEFRDSLKRTYSSSSVSGDGQVVVINFTDNISFEVLPAFINKDGTSFTYPDSNAGGSWKVTNPIPEITAISTLNTKSNGNLKDLCKMTRAWKDACNVPMGGLLIDSLAHKFIDKWEHQGKTVVYYDYMVRDFFLYLQNQDSNQEYWYAVGSGQKIIRKGYFEFKSKVAHNLVLEAIESYNAGYEYTARSKMREVYGNSYPA